MLRYDSNGGYLFKYPSEDSNDQVLNGAFPAKCTKCSVAWASDASAMRAHRNECAGKETQTDLSFGDARKFWFELNYELGLLEWRLEDQEVQSHHRLVLHTIERVDVLDEEVWQIVAQDRILRFKCTDIGERDDWIEQLTPFIVQKEFQVVEKLLSAIRLGHVEDMNSILKSDESLVYTLDKHGNSLASIACVLGAGFDVFYALLAFGADFNTINYEGEFPLLMLAAANEHELLAILIEMNVMNLNLQNEQGIAAIHAAAANDESQALQLLLQKGCTPYVTDFRGWTAMHYAAVNENGHEAMHVLCDVAMDLIDQQDQNGDTALHLAAQNGYSNVVQALVETAAATDIVNHDMKKAMDLAKETSHSECYQILENYQNVSSSVTYDPIVYERNHEQSAANAQEIYTPWQLCYDENNYAYYYNNETGESQWAPTENDHSAPIECLPFVAGDARVEEIAAQAITDPVSPISVLMNGDKGTKFVKERRMDRKKRRQKKAATKEIVLGI